MPADQLRYLTAEQSLADVPYFAQRFSRPNFQSIDLSPKSTPWIFIGGSYSGVRAAWMRNIYPETIFAAYSSSAYPEVRLDTSDYNELVYRALGHFGFGNCTKDVVAAIAFMDDAMDDTDRSADLKEAFLDRGGRSKSNVEFALNLAAIIPGAFQYYGVEGSGHGESLRSFCDWISTDPDTNETSGADGWAKTKGAEFSVGRWSTWPPMRSLVCQDCDPQDPKTEPDEISWTWQICTQFGEGSPALFLSVSFPPGNLPISSPGKKASPLRAFAELPRTLSCSHNSSCTIPKPRQT